MVVAHRQHVRAVRVFGVVALEHRCLPGIDDQLRRPGDARRDGEHALPGYVVVVDERRGLGTRSEQQHLAADHVPKLWELVEMAAAQPFSRARDAVVVTGGDPASRREPPGKLRSHRSQLPQPEQASVTADAQQSDQSRAGIGPPDEIREQADQRRDRNREACGHHSVEPRADAQPAAHRWSCATSTSQT